MTASKIALPFFCPMTEGSPCNLSHQAVSARIRKSPYVHIIIPYEDKFNEIEKTIRTIVDGKRLRGKKLKGRLARDFPQAGSRYCAICKSCWFSAFGIAELGDLNDNVLIEIGLMFGFGKYIIFTLDEEYVDKESLPFNIDDFMHIEYKTSLSLSGQLDEKIDHVLELLKP